MFFCFCIFIFMVSDKKFFGRSTSGFITQGWNRINLVRQKWGTDETELF